MNKDQVQALVDAVASADVFVNSYCHCAPSRIKSDTKLAIEQAMAVLQEIAGQERKSERQALEDNIASQRDWIEHCGGTRAGYVERYGGVRTQREAEAIYTADMDRLRHLEKLLEMMS